MTNKKKLSTKCWPLTDEIPSINEIHAELEEAIPNIDEIAAKKNIIIYLYSYLDLVKSGDNTLFKIMQDTNKQGLHAIFIIDIFWYYQKEIILNIINHRLGTCPNPRKIGAREIELREISAAECNKFLMEYHFHGSRSSSIKLGAFYKGELVSVMAFGKPLLSFNTHKVDLEFHRHCMLPNVTVVGLIDKVFKYLKTKYNTNTVLHYKESLYYNNAEAPQQEGFLGCIGVTTYYLIDGVFYPRLQAMKMDLPLPIACYDKIGTPGSDIFKLSTIKLEDMF